MAYPYNVFTVQCENVSTIGQNKYQVVYSEQVGTYVIWTSIETNNTAFWQQPEIVSVEQPTPFI